MILRTRDDEAFMREALRFAKKGEGRTQPNPMVGVVIVRGERVIARGYHRAFGMPHAEIEALRVAGKRARGATLYSTLEPCRHVGKTPPCADAIIRAGIRRVVSATRDPNGIARGGIEKLRKAGIRISVGACEKGARELNEAFFIFHEKNRPFVALKFAASLDGKLATRTGDSKWITHERARRYARRLRGLHQAVVVGIETVLADDPALTARTKGMREPLRIILDSRLRIPLNARVLTGNSQHSSIVPDRRKLGAGGQNVRTSNVIVATTARAPARKKEELERRGVRILTYSGNHVPIKRLLASLRELNITSVLVEGGAAVLGNFLDAGFVDKVYAFYAPLLIGGEKSVTIRGSGARTLSDALRFRRISVERFDDDILIVESR